MHRPRLKPAVPALLLVALAGVSACGSGAAAGGGDDGPIKIMNISTLDSPATAFKNIEDTMNARVKAINASGGIKGRQIEIDYCNDKNDANAAAACAQKAVQEKVVAVVGSTTAIAAPSVPILEKAGIPYLGPLGSSPIELQSSVSFPVGSGAAGLVTGDGRWLVDNGFRNIGIISGDHGSAKETTDQVVLGVEAGGGTIAKRVVGHGGKADWTPEATAMKGVDGVVLVTFQADAVKIVNALRQVGYTGAIAGSSSILPAPSLQALGDGANGITLIYRMAPVTSTNVPGVAQYRDEVQKENPSVTLDEVGINAWTAMNFFAELARRAPQSDAAGILQTVRNLDTPIDLLGVVPPYQAGAKAPHDQFPQAHNFTVTSASWNNGTLVPSGAFFDPLR